LKLPFYARATTILFGLILLVPDIGGVLVGNHLGGVAGTFLAGPE